MRYWIVINDEGEATNQVGGEQLPSEYDEARWVEVPEPMEWRRKVYSGGVWLDTTTYLDSRLEAYPNIGDQLDTIYHEGIETWKASITAVKDLYPKV